MYLPYPHSQPLGTVTIWHTSKMHPHHHVFWILCNYRYWCVSISITDLLTHCVTHNGHTCIAITCTFFSDMSIKALYFTHMFSAVLAFLNLPPNTSLLTHPLLPTAPPHLPRHAPPLPPFPPAAAHKLSITGNLLSDNPCFVVGLDSFVVCKQ